MSSFAYQEPPWSYPPAQNTWRLVEIKGGVEVASHSLDKACIVLGRASTDLPLWHDSCSRFHARIAFDASGTPWLRDLQSAHGTTVNRKRLPAAAIGKQESTSLQAAGYSRGVVLYPGDLLQFGASTRMYCLEGPPEYDRGVIRNKREVNMSEPQAAQAPTNQTAETNQKDEGLFSWGMADNDNAHDLDTTDDTSAKKQSLPTNLDSVMIPDKHRKLFERLTAKRYKLQNVELESERIRQKGELSQGQEAQLSKNNERIIKWQEEIEELEQELHVKLYPDRRKSPARKKHAEDTDDDDDYDFYDRTRESENDLFDSEEGESQESLVKKWKELVSEWKQGTKSELESQQKVDRLSQSIQSADPNDEDVFFLQNDLNLQKDSLQKVREKRELTSHNLSETERLLRIINGKLEFDRETGYVGEPSTQNASTESDAAMMPPPVRLDSPGAPRVTLSPSASMLPPPKMPPPMLLGDCMPPPAMQPPPQKRMRVMGPTMPPAAASADTSIIGTLSVLSSGREKKAKSPKQKKQADSKSNVDPKKDVWKAPQDQDGSGMTKLNAKFAGRY